MTAASHHGNGSGSALFGLFPGRNSTEYLNVPPAFDSGDYFSPMLAWQGKNNDIVNVYDQIANSDDTVFSSYLPKIWSTYHSVPMLSLNTNNGTPDEYTNAQVARGDADSEIVAYAHKLKTFISGPGAPAGGRRIYIRLNWEMNESWYHWAPPNTASDCTTLLANEHDYVQMWRRVHDLVMSTGGFDKTQVQWVYSIYTGNAGPTGCENGASDVVAESYPGDAYVDWVGIDGYGINTTLPQIQPAALFGPWIANLRKVTTKPLSINEVGVSTHNDGSADDTVANKAAWITSYFKYIESENVKMSLWFNTDLGPTYQSNDFAIFSKKDNLKLDPYSTGDEVVTGADGVAYNAYAEYKAGIGSSYFISPDPSNPRLLTDAEFQGS